ncbi:ParB/RepB/Spo0J family partition protein [Mahella australiensis]|uniref:Chromosome segregation DNA-binding protein n=1 Tax=Mahella australiensis (strain DSM 15567 / CIP 107919 / 50-1 BON) TaxID=697281 RepID=F4A0Z5_MAHA5|nr:ParB/RepB/Spo0J family partition protein [Mahella australiensis]AEE98072.1 chromosome segregation DNA-binding protein [Mahella australiensis 50-1 BON]
MPKRALGKGLQALIPESINETDEHEIQELRISDIDPNDLQPRKVFDENALSELAQSIKQYGVIQPITVKPVDDRYMIVTGERRWRAARIAGLKTIPAIVKEFNTKEILEIALIENLQREDLNPIEEAMALKTLIDDFDLTQEELAARVGKSRSAIANTIRLLNLPQSVQDMMMEGLLSAGHARALLSVESEELQQNLAKSAVEKGLTVRELEELIKHQNKEHNRSDKRNKDSYIPFQEYADSLSRMLGTKVNIVSGKRKGRIEIEYYDTEDLYRILDVLNK